MATSTKKKQAGKQRQSGVQGFTPAGETVESMCAPMRQMVEESPLLSTLVGFGTGLAVGAVVGRALAGPGHCSPTFRQKVLEALGSALPETVREKVWHS